MLLSFNLFYISNPFFATILISMLPFFELKGAIPVGMSYKLYGTNALSFWQAFLCSILGTIIITPIILLVLKPIINYLKNTKTFKNLILKYEFKINKNTQKTKNYSTFKKYLYLFIFVAIPLPLTGIYTGCAISSFLNLKFGYSYLVITLANIVSGFIISVLSYFCKQHSLIIVISFVLIFLVIICFNLIKNILKKS